MKLKKFLTVILSVTMILSAMALPAFADGDVVAKINDTDYTDLATALKVADEGDTVVLQDNITLTGEWAPIAGFKGTFDGNGKTISGLKITAAGKNTKDEAATGLFADLPATAVVKDLTIDGAEIKFSDATTQVGILAGYLYGATVENIMVTDAVVDVTGGQYVGGLCGKLFGTATNCTVSNSTITGKDQIGGLVGYAWIGHIDSCKSISNTIKATEERAGGLIGKMSILKGDIGSGSQYVQKCTVSGGSDTAPDFAGGLIAQFMGDCDGYSITGNTVEKITLNAPKTSAFATIRDDSKTNEAFMDALKTNVTDNKFSVAAIGNTEYASLKDALEAAQDGETVKLLADDIEVTESITMSADKKITLDTAGRTVTFNGGSISLYGSSLSVTGSGTIKHVKTSGGTQAIYVLNAKSILTIDSVEVNAGSDNGLFAAEAGSIVINGGNFTMTNGGAVTFAFGENTKVEINGGTFVGRDGGEGAVYAFNGANVAVSGGKFDIADQAGKYNYTFCDYSGLIGYPDFQYDGNNVTSKGIFKVTGGTYNKDITNLTQLKYVDELVEGNFGGFVAEGYIVIKNTDGTYTVTKENFDNENVTTEEKVDTINNVVISKDNTEVTEKVVETIKTLPVEKKEEVAPAKVEEIIATKDASEVKEVIAATTASEDTAAVAATVKSIDSSLELKIEPKAAADSTIKLPEGTKTARFEVTVEKVTGSSSEAVTETDVPLLLTFTVDDGTNVKSVIRNHGGIQESVPFTQDGNTIKVSAAKFSEYDVVFAATPTTGSAVLAFEDDIDGDGICNLYLVGDIDATVTNFESGEFMIANTVTSGKVGIEITGAEGLTIDEVKDGYYKIHRPDGSKTYCPVEAGSKILLGTIALSGTGKGQIYAENIKMYIKSNDSENLAVEIPTVSDYVNYDIKAEAATLTVNVAFPNAVGNQVTAYQDMKITISGGDLADDLVYKLGSDASANVVWANTTYTLTVADNLTKNVAYTVKVEGAGYRTARYIVNMTGAKTLNFWNNVKDTAICVEEGVGTAKNTTFLAGDIVKDNQINIYDLSAVVSYFGTDNLVADHPEYAKYDLNRDGKIDSKDIAYVLVSWGN